MKRLGLLVSLVLALPIVGCSESHSDEDGGGGGITFDASFPDAGPSPEELCGNGALDPGEMCDDGNNASNDGCDSSCNREAFCGDTVTDDGEVCDDGNNRSGDGCRSDCQSDESCGNGIVDFAAGEVCDDDTSCADDCASVTGCGDGSVVAPEVCDDGNSASWDGCSSACGDEQTLVISSLGLARRTEGCDFNGDGSPDNAFAGALGLLATALGPLIQSQIDDGQLLVILGMLGLDDPAAVNDDDFRIAWLAGTDADGDAANNFSGSAEMLIQPDSLNADGTALTSIQSSVSSSEIAAGPEDIPIPLGFFPIELRQGRVEGTTVADAGEVYEIRDGQLCGGIPLSLLGLLGGFLGDMLMTAPSCDGGDPPTLLDLLLAGGDATISFGAGMAFPLSFRATPPDLDLDGDGLEGFTAQTDGPDDCQPVITSCRDGDGTVIEGRGCFNDARIGDGHSAAFNFDAIRVNVVGVEDAAPAPGP